MSSIKSEIGFKCNGLVSGWMARLQTLIRPFFSRSIIAHVLPKAAYLYRHSAPCSLSACIKQSYSRLQSDPPFMPL